MRRSKREIEQTLETLSDGPRSDERETFIERHYSEALKEYACRLARDQSAIKFGSEIANLDAPERTRRILAILRDRHGIDTDRDEAVLETLQTRVSTSEFTSPGNVLVASVAYGPALLNDSERDAFDAHRAAGREDAADELAMRAVYQWLAGDAREVTVR